MKKIELNEIVENLNLDFFKNLEGFKFNMTEELYNEIHKVNKKIKHNTKLIIEDLFSMLPLYKNVDKRLLSGEIITLGFNPKADLTGDKEFRYRTLIDFEKKELEISKGVKVGKGLRSVIIYENGNFEVIKVEEKLENYYSLIGCKLVEILSIGDGVMVIIDEEGKFGSKTPNKGFQPFRSFDLIHGNIIISKDNGEGGFKDLDVEEINKVFSFIGATRRHFESVKIK